MKVIRILVTSLMIVFCVCACCLPTFALTVSGNLFDQSVSSGVPHISSINDMYIEWKGITSITDAHTPYSYAPHNVISGEIGHPEEVTLDPFVKFDESVDYYYIKGVDSLTAPQNEMYYMQNRPVNSTLYKIDLNGVDEPGFAGTYGSKAYGYPYNERYVWLRYWDHNFLLSDYKPNGVVLSCDSYYLNAQLMRPDYYERGLSFLGYGGIVLTGLTSSSYYDLAYYDFSCTVVDVDFNEYVFTSSNHVDINDSGEAALPLIPLDVIQKLTVNDSGNYYLEVKYLKDIVIEYELADVQVPATSSTDTSFTFRCIYDIIAGDKGRYETGSSSYYDNFDLLAEAWHRRILKTSEAYETGYNDGYNAGYNIGYDSGYDAGVASVPPNDDGSYDEGYKIGYRSGYLEGQKDPTQALRDEIYDHGFRDGMTAGINQATMNMDFTTWLGHSVSGFMDFTIFSNITIGGILYVCIAIGLVLAFLKIFAGG